MVPAFAAVQAVVKGQASRPCAGTGFASAQAVEKSASSDVTTRRKGGVVQATDKRLVISPTLVRGLAAVRAVEMGRPGK